MRAFVAAIAAVMTVFLLAGCSDHGSPLETDDPPVDNGPVSFTDDIQPIFNSNCIGCHGEGGNAGLDLRSSSSYNNLVGVAATNSMGILVVAGDSESSVIAQRLNGALGGFMPPTGPLQDPIRALVLEWINDGALEN